MINQLFKQLMHRSLVIQRKETREMREQCISSFNTIKIKLMYHNARHTYDGCVETRHDEEHRVEHGFQEIGEPCRNTGI